MTAQLQVSATPLGSVPESAAAAALKADVCESAVRACQEQFSDHLEALVLTGSLARDEATVVEENGRRCLLGDAEFLAVFTERKGLPPEGDLDLVRQRIERDLERQSTRAHVSLGAAHPAYLGGLRPHIFAYELRACGQVVWGEKAILSLIPAFSPAEIPLEDAWRLLCNRMVEQLEAVGEMSHKATALTARVQYLTVKLYLDMATSLLVFAGAYEPSYRARAERLGALAESAALDGDCPFPPRRFAEQVAGLTHWKLAPENELGWECWEAAVTYARQLWGWELGKLCGLEEPLSDTELLRRWMQRQPLTERLRGWLYVLRAQGWHRSWPAWPRWTRQVWRASPRYSIYAAASELFFRLPSLVRPATRRAELEADWEGMRSRLPVVGKFDQRTGVAAWERLAAEIVWNYHQFLEGTRS